MSRRNSMQVCGAYDPESKSFRVETIPAPPQARRVDREDEVTGERTLGYEIDFACPHCHEDTALVFATERSSGEMMRKFDAMKREVERLRMENEILSGSNALLRGAREILEQRLAEREQGGGR